MGPVPRALQFKGGRKRRSKAQKQQTTALTASSASIVSSDDSKENDSGEHLQTAKRRGDHYQKELYATRKKLKRSHTTNANQAAVLAETRQENNHLNVQVHQLEAEVVELAAESSSLHSEVQSQKSARQVLSKKLNVVGQKVRRIPDRLETVATKATKKARDEFTQLFSFSLKEKGVVPDQTRDMINDLVALDGVRPNKVIGVLKRIAGKLGIAVTGNASDRTVRRIVKEGGVGSQMQFVEAVGNSKGVTPSSDGTTHKNINLEGHRATVIGPDNKKQTFFLGIGMAINHMSETQLEGWEELIETAYRIYKTSPRCQTADNARDFWLKVTGWHSDHAEDQKKLFRLIAAMKTRLERERRGERTIAEMAPAQWADILFKVSQAGVAAAGGITAWEQLDDAERLYRHDEAFTEFVRELGQEQFDKLTPEEKQSFDLFIWGGCCMHKNMNVFKGGVLGMQQWWVENGHPGPLKMFNRDNAAAATLGIGTEAATRAEDRTFGGAIKVSSLAGAIFRHKDQGARESGGDEVGGGLQQAEDTLRYFWDHETGLNICFPDTSNTRFQSHAAAYEIIVLHMELLLQFLVYVRENKASRALNHMELNVERGLSCWSTRHEFVVIALLNQNIDVPYMLEKRGPLRAEDNLLRLGPLHKKVRAHMEKIAANPKIITGTDATFETSSLDGKMWQNPEVVYAARARIVQWKLEHVDALIVAYCKAALIIWGRFDTEWADDGPISTLSQENIERAWLEVTNDGNESELGILRQASKSAPNMSLAYHNAMRMYKANKTSAFLPTLTPQDRQIIRAQVRKEDSSGSTRQKKHAQVVHMKEVVDRNTKRDDDRKDRADKVKQILAEVVAITSVQEFEAAFEIGRGSAGYLTVAALDLQLDWHLANSVKESTDSVETSASGIPTAKSGPKGRGNRANRYEYLKAAISKRSHTLERVAAGLCSIVEEPAPNEIAKFGAAELDGSPSPPVSPTSNLAPSSPLLEPVMATPAEAAAAAFEARMTRLEATIDQLAHKIENPPSPHAPSPAPSLAASAPDPGPGIFGNIVPGIKSALRLNPLFVFDGDRTRGRAFLHAVQTYARLLPEAFVENGEPSEEKVVRYALSFMALESVQRWAEHHTAKAVFPFPTWDVETVHSGAAVKSIDRQVRPAQRAINSTNTNQKPTKSN
ncbi:hypothetical protein C8F04DRAFT_1271864 [Mycena alexandri]|uniref:Uncharacterized protein n=1 Tax=Mycena alexandri TaxID=1745969 RepID=A0AAD6SCJ1_9AGAR|nr:hypothetical protein C8F04DRAFT_1271864 [Mycena alexandri]